MKEEQRASDNSDYMKFLANEKVISDQIIDHSRSMISIINRNYIYEKVNNTFCNVHQVESDSIIGKSLADVWGYETFRNKIKSNIDLCFSGKTVRYETILKTSQSGKRYFEVVFRPLSSNTGDITHLLAETFDINELWQSKQAIIEKEEEFRKFENNLPIGFLRCDTRGEILNANNAFLKIIEWDAGFSIVNTNLKSFYHEEGFFEMQYESLLEFKTKTFGRISLKNCKGREISCRISGFLYVNESGTPLYIDFVVEDCSRELMLENRLLQAQKLETIGALAGGIAHDFNNILATISGYSEMLLDDLPKNSASSEKANKIQAAVLKARSIINQMLTFSRQVEQEKIQINVSEVLKDTIGFVKSSIPSNVIVKSRILKKDAIVFADPTQLFRVFLNLMTNAIQSMEEKGGTLSVNLAVAKGNLIKYELTKDIVADEYVMLTFKDTGKGMEPSLAGRIFEPFFTTREVGKGTGLGLSVIHGILTEMEGEILVSSEKGKGSVFNVFLPVSKEYSMIPGKIAITKRILFITGNKYESRILSLALENTGYELLYVSDRKQLSKIMISRNDRPDLIIYMSDSKQILPEDLLHLFRRLEIHTPCILISDPNKDSLTEKILNSGIIEQHLLKPVSLREIRNAIQQSIKYSQ